MNTTTRAREERAYVFAFLDLSFYAKDASQRPEREVADTIAAYYERVGEHVGRAGGTVVKFIGDGALLVFPPERADAALAALLALRTDVDAWLARAGWSSRLTVKAHAGTAIAGDYGAGDAKRFDVIGNAVNVTARLPRPFRVTPQVFRLLSAEGRKRLKKHTPPITYIPVADRHA